MTNFALAVDVLCKLQVGREQEEACTARKSGQMDFISTDLYSCRTFVSSAFKEACKGRGVVVLNAY
jgi:hypothetical protein